MIEPESLESTALAGGFFTTSIGTPSLNISGEIGCHFRALRPQAPWFCIASTSPLPLGPFHQPSNTLMALPFGGQKGQEWSRTSLLPTPNMCSTSSILRLPSKTSRKPVPSILGLGPQPTLSPSAGQHMCSSRTQTTAQHLTLLTLWCPLTLGPVPPAAGTAPCFFFFFLFLSSPWLSSPVSYTGSTFSSVPYMLNVAFGSVFMSPGPPPSPLWSSSFALRASVAFCTPLLFNKSCLTL